MKFPENFMKMKSNKELNSLKEIKVFSAFYKAEKT